MPACKCADRIRTSSRHQIWEFGKNLMWVYNFLLLLAFYNFPVISKKINFVYHNDILFLECLIRLYSSIHTNLVCLSFVLSQLLLSLIWKLIKQNSVFLFVVKLALPIQCFLRLSDVLITCLLLTLLFDRGSNYSAVLDGGGESSGGY